MKKGGTQLDICIAFDVNINTVQACKKLGLRLAKKGDDNNFEEIAEFLIAHDDVRSDIKLKAEKVLHELRKDKKKTIGKAKKTKKEPVKRKVKEKQEEYDTGLEENLYNLSEACAEAHDRYRKSLDPQKDEDYEISPAVALKQWADVSELLRKTEMDCFKMLEQKKKLVNLDSVRGMINAVFSGLSKAVIMIPQKIAPELDGAEWHVIQDTMRKEIINVFEQFRKELENYKLD